MSRKAALLVAPLPPPTGGVANWTQRVLRSDVPGWRVDLVDTRIRSQRKVFDSPRISEEVVRTAKICGRLVRALVCDKPDLVHVTSSMSPVGVFRDLLCVCLARVSGCKVAVHYRGNIASFKPSACRGLSGRAMRRIANLATVNLVLWPGAAADLAILTRGAVIDRTEILPTFVSDDWPGSVEPRATGQRLRLIFVGGLAVQKGVLELVEVAYRLQEYDFVIVGWPTDHLRMDPEETPANCIFLGPQTPVRVAAELLAADVFFFPSRTEGCPNVVLEAMAAGLPIVASSVGAIPHLVRDGEGGFLVKPRDIDGFVDAVRMMASDSERRQRFGERNRHAVNRHYRASVVLARMGMLWGRAAAGATQGHL